MITGSTSGIGWLAISATDEDVDGVKQSGILRLYTLSESAAELVAGIAPEKGDGAEWARFGKVLAKDGDNGLWIGSEFWDAGRGAIWWVDIGKALDREVLNRDRAATHAQMVLEERKEGVVKKIPLKPVRVGQEANVFPPRYHFCRLRLRAQGTLRNINSIWRQQGINRWNTARRSHAIALEREVFRISGIFWGGRKVW